jgi:MoaA/NifB/PqqE/SkfB family radical SAM enzyme
MMFSNLLKNDMYQGGINMIEVAVFPCTYRCDGKCIMCSVYERNHKDLSVQTFERIFSSKKLIALKSINVTGGEPTLREDLCELIQMICSNCKLLKEIIINTNGLNPVRIMERIKEVINIIPDEVKLWVYVSLDSLGENADYIRGVKNASTKAIQTLTNLRELKSAHKNVEVAISCTITSANCSEIGDIYNYAQKNNLIIDFIYATVNTAFINSLSKKENFLINDQQKEEVISFLEKVREYSITDLSKAHFTKLIENINGIEISKECILRDGRGILIEADGKIRACGMTDEVLLGDLTVKEYNFENLGQSVEEKYKDYCAQCNTDSYYNWTKFAQSELLSDMLMTIKDIRQR